MCRVACAREVEETVSEGVLVRVLDAESRLYFQVINGRRHSVIVVLWFTATGEEKFELPPDRVVSRLVRPGEAAVLFQARLFFIFSFSSTTYSPLTFCSRGCECGLGLQGHSK